ncbi:hypothetical protein DWY20_08315 [Phocaeicola coprocola]|uniref:Uncharacterized protein n=1 Tax=Phocaeicola coprocola TaxID=310298 RepID=A0A412GM41_9BACT|nr:hypothetical protein DWY20_08315 [Phocaeicola coprocola]
MRANIQILFKSKSRINIFFYLQPYPDNSGTTLKNKKQNYIKRLTIYTKVQEPINRHNPTKQ